MLSYDVWEAKAENEDKPPWAPFPGSGTKDSLYLQREALLRVEVSCGYLLRS